MNAGPEISLVRASRISFALGTAAFIACLAGGLVDRREFFLSYLFGFLVCLGLVLGCSGFLMIHHLTGGTWGYPVRRFFESAIGTLPLLAVLFLPMLIGLQSLYPWARAADVGSDRILQHKHAYMNGFAFFVRAVILFSVWIAGARLLNRWSTQQDATSGVEPTRKLRRLSGPGLVIYPLTVTFAYVDWVMSMEADWYSTIFPLLVCIGQMLSALAFVIILAAFFESQTGLAQIMSKENFHHLGNLLLAFTMMWAYLAYSQLIVIWSGDLPHEISWYLHRIAGGWRLIALVLLLFHFLGPFLLLLFRQIKRSATALVVIASVIFVTHIIDVWWMLAPSIYQTGFHFSWMATAGLLGVGGIWFGAFLSLLSSKSLIPLNDPRFVVALVK